MFENFFSLQTTIDFETNFVLLIIIGSLLILTCLKLIFSETLIETIILMSIFSLLISLCYLLMDAPDVAMTEVALGACLSTCVLLNFIRIVETKDKLRSDNKVISLILCLSLVSVLSWAALDLPEYGAKNSALQSHVNKYYIENTQKDTGLPSYVAAILASYRGYDTLGETSVILIAGLGVLLILSRRKEENA